MFLLCAVCYEANDDFVSTGKVVDSLHKLQSQVTSVNIDLLSENDDDDDTIITMTVIMNYVLLLICYLKIERQMCVEMPICQTIMVIR